MGNIKESIEKIIVSIKQLRGEIKDRKYFELGDDPTTLENTEGRFAEIYMLLGTLDESYSLKSMSERNSYYQAVKIAHETQDFLKNIHWKGKGSKENTIRILMYLDELIQATASLEDIRNIGLDEPIDLTSNPKEKSTKLPIRTPDKTSSKKTSTNYEQLVFISYAWGDKREEIVNQLEEALQQRGIKIIRDKKDLRYKGSIREFMERIGRSNCVIVVISDKYLRSKNCMFELVEIAENKQFADRIFPIILSDARIYDPVERLDYVEHWDKEKGKLNERMRSLLDQSNLKGIREELDNYDRFRDEISELTSTLKDMNALTPEMHQESNFSELYEAIERRMLLQ